ncbi:MAG: hypothetical protein ACYC61_30260 [Isosphaeraceae bacterium]
MEIQGRLYRGVVVLEGELPVPEGTMVTVVCDLAPLEKTPESHRRVQLPLVPSREPGVLRLTNERVAEILDEDDLPA